MTMRRRAINARWGLLLFAAFGPGRMQLDRSAPRLRPSAPPTPEQAARNQQISEHAQEAIDRGDYEQARLELLQLAGGGPGLRPRRSSGWARSCSSRAGCPRRKPASGRVCSATPIMSRP